MVGLCPLSLLAISYVVEVLALSLRCGLAFSGFGSAIAKS